MIAPQPEAFVKRALVELGTSGCTKVSPFFTAANYEDLKARLEGFSEDISLAIQTVKVGAGLMSEVPEDQESSRQEQSTGLARFILGATLSDKHTPNKEKTLREVFLNEVGIASNALRTLEQAVREEQAIPRPVLLETVQCLVGLDHFVRAIPKVYESISPQTQMEQDFVFRSHDIA